MSGYAFLNQVLDYTLHNQALDELHSRLQPKDNDDFLSKMRCDESLRRKISDTFHLNRSLTPLERVYADILDLLQNPCTRYETMSEIYISKEPFISFVIKNGTVTAAAVGTKEQIDVWKREVEPYYCYDEWPFVSNTKTGERFIVR